MISQAKPIATAVPLSTLGALSALDAVGSTLLGGLGKAHGGAIKRHGASAKQRFMRSTTAKVATGLGVAGLATSALNQAIRREDQKAHLAATSGKSMAKVERIWGSVTDNTIAAGVSIEEQVQLMQAMQDMGGLLDVGVKTPKAPLRFFSDILQGTGAAAQDVARKSNILVQALDVDKSLCDFGRTGQPRQRHPGATGTLCAWPAWCLQVANWAQWRAKCA